MTGQCHCPDLGGTVTPYRTNPVARHRTSFTCSRAPVPHQPAERRRSRRRAERHQGFTVKGRPSKNRLRRLTRRDAGRVFRAYSTAATDPSTPRGANTGSRTRGALRAAAPPTSGQLLNPGDEGVGKVVSVSPISFLTISAGIGGSVVPRRRDRLGAAWSSPRAATENRCLAKWSPCCSTV